jgi:hypothetical protein
MVIACNFTVLEHSVNIIVTKSGGGRSYAIVNYFRRFHDGKHEESNIITAEVNSAVKALQVYSGSTVYLLWQMALQTASVIADGFFVGNGSDLSEWVRSGLLFLLDDRSRLFQSIRLGGSILAAIKLGNGG